MLTVTQLSKSFHLHTLGGKRIDGFADLSFSVSAGRLLVLRAPSGAGKSSVLRCIYRTYLPSGGRIDYRSQAFGPVDLARLDEQRLIRLRRTEIGFVTQFLKVLPRIATLDLVAEPLLTAGWTTGAARREARGFLRRLGIPTSHWDAYPATFSGGEQQRVNFARAVIWRPRLLLLDEPTASLDPASTATVLEVLGDMKRQGAAMVGIFHDPHLAAQIADEVLSLPTKELTPCPLPPAAGRESRPRLWS